MSIRNPFNIIFKEKDIVAKVYIIIFILIMFSGSTFLEPFTMYFVCTMIILLLLMSSVKGVQRNAFLNPKSYTLHFIMFLIILYFVYQMSYSFAPSTTLVFIERFAVFLMIMFIPARLDLNYRVIKAIRLYCFPVAISILLTTWITGEKSGGLVGNYQFSGMLMSIGFGVILIDYYFERNKFNFIGLALTFLALMTSGKRMFVILAMLSYFLIYKLSVDKNKLKRYFILTGILCVVILVTYFSIPAVRLVFERINEYSGDATFNGRIYYWVAAEDMFANNPIKGIGMGCFSQYFETFYYRFGNSNAWDAHNIYVQMMAELGVIGESLFIVFFLFSLITTLALLKNKLVQEERKCMYVLCYSILIQIWFLIYGFSGNPLYGAGQSFLYIGAITMMLSIKIHIKRGKTGLDENK